MFALKAYANHGTHTHTKYGQHEDELERTKSYSERHDENRSHIQQQRAIITTTAVAAAATASTSINLCDDAELSEIPME